MTHHTRVPLVLVSGLAGRHARRTVVTDQTPPDEIDAALRGALLTEAELAAGPGAWAHYPDPFGDWHGEPPEDTEPTRRGATAANRKEDR